MLYNFSAGLASLAIGTGEIDEHLYATENHGMQLLIHSLIWDQVLIRDFTRTPFANMD